MKILYLFFTEKSIVSRLRNSVLLSRFDLVYKVLIEKLLFEAAMLFG